MFKDILQSLPYRVWVIDMEGNELWHNRVADDSDELGSSFLRSIAGKPSGEVELQRRGGWVRVKYNPVFARSGEQVGYYGIESDITLQKEALPKLLKMKSEVKNDPRRLQCA